MMVDSPRPAFASFIPQDPPEITVPDESMTVEPSRLMKLPPHLDEKKQGWQRYEILFAALVLAATTIAAAAMMYEYYESELHGGWSKGHGSSTAATYDYSETAQEQHG